MSNIDYYSKYKKYKRKYILLQNGGGVMLPDEAEKILKMYTIKLQGKFIFPKEISENKGIKEIFEIEGIKEIFEIEGIKEFFNDININFSNNNDLNNNDLIISIKNHQTAVVEMIIKLTTNLSKKELEILTLRMAINVLIISRTEVIVTSLKEIIIKMLPEYNKMFPLK
jgi:hypothetical protein